MSRIARRTVGVAIALCLASSTAAATDVAKIGDAELVAADDDLGNWLSHGRTYAEQRFSPLAYIHDGNVGDLELSWTFPTGLTRGHEATPIVVDGVLYFTGTWSVVFAVDKSGSMGQGSGGVDRFELPDRVGVPHEKILRCRVVRATRSSWKKRKIPDPRNKIGKALESKGPAAPLGAEGSLCKGMFYHGLPNRFQGINAYVLTGFPRRCTMPLAPCKRGSATRHHFTPAP